MISAGEASNIATVTVEKKGDGGPIIEKGLEADTTRARYLSSFLSAALIFLLLNVALACTKPISFDPYAFPYRGWVWWQIHDLRTSPEHHNVVLLGSSLVISAINCCDANFLNKKFDQSEYHAAAYLDHCLAQKFGGKFKTFDMATPGQSPADAFLGLKAMVKMGNKPDVVIYGIAPRDFIDGTMDDIADGESYRYFSRFFGQADTEPDLAYHWPIRKLEYDLQRALYLSGSAMDLQMLWQNSAAKVLDKLVPNPPQGEYFTWWDRNKFFPKYKAGDMYAGACMVEPMLPGAAHKFVDNTKDYQDRYKSPRKWVYYAQIHFLKRLMQYCSQEHIKLILVNMPITQYNTCMLRQGVYMHYVDEMSQIAAAQHVTFIDLCKFDRYPLTLYNDYVHLNGAGGKLFVDDLTDRLAKSDAAAACKRAGLNLQNCKHSAKAYTRAVGEGKIDL